MPFEYQESLARRLVISPNSGLTYGTALADLNLVHTLRFDPGAFARWVKEFRNDLDRSGKGHSWATEHQEISRRTTFGLSGELTDFLAGWLCVFAFGKVTTTGAGPYTHTIVPLTATNIAPFTTIYFEDTADIKYKLIDLSVSDIEIAGANQGALTFQCNMLGSGKHADGAMVGGAPALPTPVYLLGSDTDVLLGPSGAPVSIKERVRSWNWKYTTGNAAHSAPGGGLYATFNKMGIPRATLSIVVSAKDVDDIRTLFLNDTLQEVQINTTSGGKSLNVKFANVKFSGCQLGVDGAEEVWQLEANEGSIFKVGAVEAITVTCINGQATYLVAA